MNKPYDISETEKCLNTLITLKCNVINKADSLRELMGICGNFEELYILIYGKFPEHSLENIYKKYYKTWEHYSGSPGYPVPSLNKKYTSALYYLKKGSKSRNKWVGKYGKLRMDLLNHLIECVEKELDTKSKQA